MKPIVTYESTYGSTKKYAETLAARCGVNAMLFDEALPELSKNYQSPLVVFSPIYGLSHPGVKFLTDHDFGNRPVALVTVGMSLDDFAVEKDQAGRSLGDKADAVKRFYFPGRLYYSELSKAHKSSLWALVNVLRAKPKKIANEKMLIDTYGKDIDRVDLSRVDEIVQWLETLS